MIEQIKTGVEVADKSIQVIDLLLARIEKYKQLQKDKSIFIRLIYLEVLNNLEVLKIINFENIKSLKPNDPKISTVLKLLKINMLEGIFFNTEDASAKEVYRRLSKKGKIDNKLGLLTRLTLKGEEVVTKNDIYENILQAISFVVTKVQLLKKIQGLDNKELDVLTNLKVQQRLVNINQRLLMIKRKLDSFDEIKAMAR